MNHQVENLIWTSPSIMENPIFTTLPEHHQSLFRDAKNNKCFHFNIPFFVFTDNSRAHRMCNCRHRYRNGNPNNPRSNEKFFSCSYWKFCTCCADIKQYEHLKKYKDTFTDNLWWVTISHSQNQHFYMDEDSVEKRYKLLCNKLKKQFSSYLLVKELNIYSLYPNVLLNPHIHFLLRSDSSPDMSNFESSKTSIHIDKVNTKKDFEHMLAYMIKPISLDEQYRQDVEKQTRRVNRHMDHFLDFYIGLINKSPQIIDRNFTT